MSVAHISRRELGRMPRRLLAVLALALARQVDAGSLTAMGLLEEVLVYYRSAE